MCVCAHRLNRTEQARKEERERHKREREREREEEREREREGREREREREEERGVCAAGKARPLLRQYQRFLETK